MGRSARGRADGFLRCRHRTDAKTSSITIFKSWLAFFRFPSLELYSVDNALDYRERNHIRVFDIFFLPPGQGKLFFRHNVKKCWSRAYASSARRKEIENTGDDGSNNSHLRGNAKKYIGNRRVSLVQHQETERDGSVLYL